MPCFHPIPAWQFPNIKTKAGKSVISLKDPYAPAGPERVAISLPCGRCVGCRTARTRSWAIRCTHEASLHDENCFITLTYNDWFLNEKGSLVKEDFVNFMKRLRKRIARLAYVSCGKKPGSNRLSLEKVYVPHPLGMFHCGEYGGKNERPHHHACLFNFDFPDRVLWKQKDGMRLYTSKMLEELWSDPVSGESLGFTTVADVTPETAAYVAGYIQKKITGARAEEYYEGRIPEYVTMSRASGIGKGWFEKYADEIYPEDELLFNGMKLKPPRFYDELFSQVDEEALKRIKKIRLDKAKDSPHNSDIRLRVREKVALAKLKTKKRSLEENET